ncbi:polysaccharide deacetylase family protein [Rhodopseudomonas pseudopalustris]|mgnify:CR=1 FL=1|uniref:polysaccharide deacetylase family protein n=1 Tax=Rhodopseudomonas pseudopalustris TaxID=1513892 RepID=UPI003F99321B
MLSVGKAAERPVVYLSVDVEGDCPPYLQTWRGLDEGLPRLLALFAEEQVPATFFTTGEAAQRFPDRIAAVVEAGHELASHGLTHRNFRDMTAAEADHEITSSAALLRTFGNVTSFRAPYLSFPEAFVPLLSKAGLTVDASRSAYKRQEAPYQGPDAPARLSTSVTSSVLRLPRAIRNPWFAMLASPVSLFVHPWEFVDFRASKLRLDCRFRTGDAALIALRSTIRWFAANGAVFRHVREHAPQA